MAKKATAKAVSRVTSKKPRASVSKSKATSSGTEVKGLKAAQENSRFAAGRWMTVKKIDEAWDKNALARREIIDIKQMAPGTVPDLYDLADGKNENASDYEVLPAPPGVQIGMKEGGAYEPVAGWGWADAIDRANHGAGSGATRLADVGAGTA